jgi:predicted amidohydrolase
VRYDKATNLRRAETLMAEARAKGAGAIVFPELFLTGYQVWDRLGDLAETAAGPSISRLAQMANAYGLLSIVGFPELDNGLIYNSACVIESDGGLLGVYRKTHLFADEPVAFTPGDSFVTFDSSIGRIGILICYDIEFPECVRTLALAGAQLILVPTANMEPFTIDQDLYARARGRENGVFIAIVNAVGADERHCYFGRSTAAGPMGEVLCRAESAEQLLIVEIDPAAVQAAQQSSPYLRRRRPEIYGALGTQAT